MDELIAHVIAILIFIGLFVLASKIAYWIAESDLPFWVIWLIE